MVKNLPNENFFISAFETGKNIILIEGDKNVDYVCMFVKDLLEQYEKINLQQHFGKVDLNKSWYIKNILDFLKQAELNE